MRSVEYVTSLQHCLLLILSCSYVLRSGVYAWTAYLSLTRIPLPHNAASRCSGTLDGEGQSSKREYRSANTRYLTDDPINYCREINLKYGIYILSF